MLPCIHQPLVWLGASQSPEAKWDKGWMNLSCRKAIYKQIKPQEVSASAQRQQAQSQHVHLSLHSVGDLAPVPKEKWCCSLRFQSWHKNKGCIIPPGSHAALLSFPSSFNHPGKLRWPHKETVATLESELRHPKWTGAYHCEDTSKR